MTSTYDDSVLDFDLNFLNQNSNGATVANTADQIKYDKQKRNMSIMKKKIIATDSLIAKYYSKKQMLYEAEKNLAATKEECKQICLDYRNALEKCSNLETERHTVQNAYKTVEERCGQLENQCEAFQSHIHQLQQLIKEKDSTLESLRVEKKKTINVKDYEKKMHYLEKEKTSLNKDVNLFADLIKKILGKRKLKSRYNDLLRKYEVRNDGSYSDASDVFEEPLSPPLSDINITKKSRIVTTDSECDYSIDTGRGSSLASDSEKFTLSPEYFINDCPTSLVAIEHRAKIKVTNVATSPIIFEETIEENIEEPSLPMIDDFEDEDESENKSTNTSQLSMVDRCLSPIRINTSRSVGTSPMENATIVQIEIQNEFESKDASTMTDIQTPTLFESKDASTITDIQTPTLFESKDASSITHIPTSLLFESKDASTETDIQTPTPFESKDASTITDIQTPTLFESKDASTVTDIKNSSLNTIDRSTSPINMTTSVSVFTNPMICVTREIATSPVIMNENFIQNESTQDIHEKECLELNNSNNLRCDKNTDFEIEMILNTMQMSHDIITPIPRTPSRVRNSEVRNEPSRLSHILENDNDPSELEELKMELNNMKSILKQHILLTSKQLSFNHEPLISKLVTDNDNINTIHCMDTNENTLSESLLDGSEIRPESNLEISQSGLVPSPIDNDLLFGSSQSSTERFADHALDDNTTRTSFPRLQDESSQQNLEEEEITTEINTETLEEISEDANDFGNQEDSEEVDEEPKAIKGKREKRKRLSKLDKLKKKLKPKYKIRSQTPPIVKLQLKAKQRSLFKKKTSKILHQDTSSILNDTSVSVNDTSISANDTIVSVNDTSATLNDKQVYEKAVKIMAELNSKKNSKGRKLSSESISKSVTLASSEEHANPNKTTQRLEKTKASEVTSKSNKDALFEEQETSLDDNITKVVASKAQISSKEVVTLEKPTKEKLIRKKSWLPLSALFDDGDESSDSLNNSIEGCKSLTSSKPRKESESKIHATPPNIVNDSNKSGNQTKRCESPLLVKANKESLSTSETSPLSTLDDNSETSNQTNRCESPVSSITNEESLSTSETSPLSVLNVTSENSNQTKLCESPISYKPTTETLFTSEISPSSVLNENSTSGDQAKDCEIPISSNPATETLFTSEISPSSVLNDNITGGDQTKRCEIPISSNPATESLSTDETSPLSVLIDNSQNGNQTKHYESPISSKPAMESVSTSETSSSILNDNSILIGDQTKRCETPASKPTKETVSTRETSPLSVLNDSSKNGNQAQRCESPISSEPMKQSVSTSEKSTSSTEISKNGTQMKHCGTLISFKPTCSFTSQESPPIVLNDKSTSGLQTKHCKSPTIFKPTKETTIKTPSTSETSMSSILTDNSKSGNLTKSPISSKSMKESVSSEISPWSINNSNIGNTKKRKSLISSEPPKKSLSTSEKLPVTILNDDSKRGSEAPSQTPELNLKELSKTLKCPLKPNSMSLFSKDTPNGEVSNSENSEQTSPKSQIATRSKSKFADPCFVVLTKDPVILSALETKQSECQKDKVKSDMTNQLASRKRRNNSSNEPEIQCKRILRSSTLYQRLSTENKEQSNAPCNDNNVLMEDPSANEMKINKISNGNLMKQRKSDNHDTVLSYDDLDLFSDGEKQPEKVSRQEKQPIKNINGFDPKQSILCCMIDKYGVDNVRKFANKKIPDAVVKMVCEKIEQYISNIIESSPAESKNLMTKFVADMQKFNHKHFIAGLMKYLTKPERKIELFSKVVSAPAPPMTKAEQILIYVILHLKTHWPSVDTVDSVLTNIEYTVFKLNRTPEFNIIESISHFYALLCRYFGAKSRLRLFILDAMYCIQFKSVPLIKQCLDVWMHIIPLAHMGIAKCPLVTCLVYLLHFYKCNDRFNRVQEIRNILSQKYFYKITDWNEAKILEMFRNTIKDLKDVTIERKMLRIALIILAKRHGPKWCQNNIIKNLLLPIIGKQNVPESVKEFCVSMIGPLMKPYPVDMKVNCEIVMNQFTEMLNKEPSQQMEEAIITSMMFINRHNQLSINKTLLSRKMKPLSSEFEGILREYVRAIPLKVWQKNISYLVHINKFN